MAIKIIEGNIFESKMQALVNPVNCVGVMGAGLAKEFKARFPESYRKYKRECDWERIKIGETCSYDENGKMIINLPTKEHWKDNSKICYIIVGMQALVKLIHSHNIKSIAIPALGCGLGGLNFTDVKPIIIEYLQDIKDLEVEIYAPKGYYKTHTPINGFERY